tara:strand:+ start:168 stop:329 length:162 start_codon:yes stop_codon:yes gene_type:complete
MNIRKKTRYGLCNQDIRDIRRSMDNVSDLAERYNIDESIVNAIRSRKLWGYVP